MEHVDIEQKVSTSPVSLRLSSDVNKRLASMAKDFGYTQNQAMDNLLTSFELQQAKSLIPERMKEIEEFENHCRRLNELFLNSLETNRNTEHFIRQEYSLKLEIQQSLIATQQEKNDELKAALGEVVEKSKQLQKTLVEVEKKLISSEAAAATQTQLISEYKEKNDTLSGLLAKSAGAVEEAGEVKQALADVTGEFASFKASAATESVSVHMDHERQIAEMERKIEKLETILEVERSKAKTDAENLTEIHHRAVEREQEKGQIELSKLENRLIAQHQATIQAVRDEANAKVAELLVRLQNATEISKANKAVQGKMTEVDIKEE